MNFSNDIDIQLYLDIQAVNYTAFKQLFQKYYAHLCRYTSSLVMDADTAEDIVQEVFVQMWENRQKVQLTGSIRSFLYTCVRNRALRTLQNEQIQQRHSSHIKEFMEYLSSCGYTEEEEEIINRIKTVMESLPPQCLKVFVMSVVDSKKYTEIASELQISVNTVKTHITKAYRLIRAQLSAKDLFVLYLLIKKWNGGKASEQNTLILSPQF